MLAITDQHCRVFFRLFSPKIRLYTEMVHSGALIHGDRSRYLAFDACEHPVALQLGGSDPAQLAKAAIYAEQAGFDEINLNVGCPSSRVQAGQFGAYLMSQPKLVADCVDAMMNAVDIPITVKHRIGVDDADAPTMLFEFVDVVSKTGCQEFIVHARKAWLKGLSPKDNRTIPQLDYSLVYRLAAHYPQLFISINGGITSISQAKKHLQHVDGVMIGRAAIENPWMLSGVSELLDEAKTPFVIRKNIVLAYCEYLKKQRHEGMALKYMIAPLMGLYKGQVNGKFWRRTLAEQCRAPEAEVGIIYKALGQMPS